MMRSFELQRDKEFKSHACTHHRGAKSPKA
jgi:hypothetical protein